MKLMKLFIVLALAGITNAAFGYDFSIRNVMTVAIGEVTLKVKVKGGSEKTALYSKYGQKHVFSFTGKEANSCLESITAVLQSGEQLPVEIMADNKSTDTCKNGHFMLHYSHAKDKFTARFYEE